jgi:thioesterase domain-containing protein
LFCVHAGSGFALPYAGLLPHLPPDVPVYGIQARGLTCPASLPATIADMARDYAGQIRAITTKGPYRLLGWCFGGRIAFEVARALRSAGQDVDLLVLMDSFPPLGDPAPGPEQMLRDLLRPPGGAVVDPELVELCRKPHDFAAIDAALRRAGHPMQHLGAHMLAQVYRIHCHGDRLNRSPIAGPLDADMVFLSAWPERARPQLRPGNWRPYLSGRQQVHPVPAGHDAMLLPEALVHVGSVLRHELAKLAP